MQYLEIQRKKGGKKVSNDWKNEIELGAGDCM